MVELEHRQNKLRLGARCLKGSPQKFIFFISSSENVCVNRTERGRENEGFHLANRSPGRKLILVLSKRHRMPLV